MRAPPRRFPTTPPFHSAALAQAAGAAAAAAPVDDAVAALPLRALLDTWRKEISELEADFNKRALVVDEYDASLRATRVGLHQLTTDVSELEEGARELEGSLARVAEEQDKMDRALEDIETKMNALLPEEPGGGQPLLEAHGTYVATAQRARAEAYEAAQQLNSLLTNLECNLDVIDKRISEDAAPAGGAADSVRRAGAGARARARAIGAATHTPPPPPRNPFPPRRAAARADAAHAFVRGAQPRAARARLRGALAARKGGVRRRAAPERVRAAHRRCRALRCA